MAQHDGVIDNADGSTFRSDCNNAIAALISNNSGASAPSVTYAYMFWADTSSGLLKLRNAANSAWVTIGTLADASLGLLSKAGGAMTGVLQQEQSSDIASGTTVDLGAATGNSVTVTHSSGSTAISSFGGASSLQKGTLMAVTFSISGGSLSLTHDGTSMFIPGSTSLTLSDKDVLIMQKTHDSSAYWKAVSGFKADGTPLVVVAGTSYVGEIFDWPVGSTPSYGLIANGAAVSRITYAALFAIYGTTFGAGDGSTTFNLPNIPAGYATVMASSNEGTTTTGQNLAHTHTVSATSAGTFAGAGLGGSIGSGGTLTTSSNGGSANLAAGFRTRKCVRF